MERKSNFFPLLNSGAKLISKITFNLNNCIKAKKTHKNFIFLYSTFFIQVIDIELHFPKEKLDYKRTLN